MSFAMNKKQTLNILMASSAAILLQGCAAALVPLAAGGLVGTAAETDPEDESESVDQTVEAIEANTGVVRVARSDAVAQEQMPVPRRAGPSEQVPRLAPEREAPPPEPFPPPPPEPESTPEPMPVQEIEPQPEEAATPVMDSELAETMRPAREPEPPAPVVVQTLPEQADEPEAVPEAAPPESAATTETRVIRIARSQMVDEQPSSISAADAVAAIASSGAAEAAAPSAPAAPEVPIVRAVSPNAITTLISYTNQQRFEPAGSRSSAILADRITLEPDRAPCLGVRPTILIDLDPQGGVLSPANASRPPSGLAGGLEQLREDGVDVAWISSNPATAANAIRETLRETGLDPYGRDQLLLVRNSDDRKQTLRDGLAESTCIVAIAGDTRSDFDELYDYLLNPEDAASLEPLFGDGWFIIPQPLLSEGSE